MSVKDDIIYELCVAICDLGASDELQAVVASYGDTLPDEQVLRYLKDWNESGKVLHERQ